MPDQAGEDALVAEAALWQVRRQDGLTAQEEQQFQDWLALDGGRADALQALERVWSGLAELPPAAVAQLRAGAQSQAPQTAPAQAVRPTQTRSSAPSHSATRPGWRSWLPDFSGLARPLATAMVAVSMCGAGWLGWRHWQAQPVFTETYATARGQLLDVTLPDGSLLKLDTATRAEVTLYRDRRLVRLAEGQAMFTVTPDASRPFDVLTGRMQVTVVGTRFSVRNTRSGLHQDGVGVQVEEGRVRVTMLEQGQPAAAPVLLTAGQYVQSAADGRLLAVQQQSSSGVMSWREGRVDFERTPLAQALAEFERYSATGLVIRDPAVAALRVNGSFDLRQAEAFSKTLPLVLPVQLRVRDGRTEIAAASAPVKK
ncbi:MAG: FecR domain-containing protein [Duganella sp.]